MAKNNGPRFFMFQNNAIRVLMIVLSLLIFVGLVLIDQLMLHRGDPGVIRVDLKDGITETLTFENLALVPGSSCEYTVKLQTDRAKACSLTLDFEETGKGTLDDFARVKILYDGTVVCDELLATVFAREAISLPIDFDQKTSEQLRIVYYLPLDVGNEAKNAKAVFELRLTANNE